MVASAWIYFTVLAGLRLGTRIGGFIGGLPSTALLSFFFIGITESPENAAADTTIFPIAISISVLFLVVYAALAQRGFWLAMVSAICFWLVSAFIIDFFNWMNFLLNLIIYAVVVSGAFITLEKILRIRSVVSEKKGQPEKHLLIRSLFGGFAVTLSVLIAKAGGPALGGIAAAFPAMFISMLTISYYANGVMFSRAMTKPLMITGMITVAVFAISIRHFYVISGLYAGTLFAIVASGISAYLTYAFILPRLK
jgi:hypothetical protein